MKGSVILLTLFAVFTAGSLSADPQKKALILYYSRTGATKATAEEIRKQTGADMFEIEPAVSYPREYSSLTALTIKELDDNARPAVKALPDNLDVYDVVFIGYPIWLGKMPMPMYTLLESINLSGKTVIPFCTSGGSGLVNTVSDIRSLCPGSTVKEGLSVMGANLRNPANAVSRWLEKVL